MFPGTYMEGGQTRLKHFHAREQRQAFLNLLNRVRSGYKYLRTHSCGLRAELAKKHQLGFQSEDRQLQPGSAWTRVLKPYLCSPEQRVTSQKRWLPQVQRRGGEAPICHLYCRKLRMVSEKRNGRLQCSSWPWGEGVHPFRRSRCHLGLR